MFIKKVLKVFSDIEVSIGPDKIYSNFLVNATISHETVFKQYIDCTNLPKGGSSKDLPFLKTL